MNQDQPPRPWWKDNWPVLALGILVVVIFALATAGYLLSWEWTGHVGVPEHPETRSGWDWLELLIIPVLLGLGAFWFNNQARKSEQEIARRERENDRERAQRDRENDRQIAEDRVREEALQCYLDRMQELILDRGLRRSEEDAEIRDVARVRTLAVLRSLDGNRKGQVVRFLYEADLIGKVVREELGERRATEAIEAILDLRTADLSSTNLYRADLRGADLSGTDLSNAHLSGNVLTEPT